MGDINPTPSGTTSTGRQYAKVRYDAPTATPAGARLIDPKRCFLSLMVFNGTAAGASTVTLPIGALAVAWQANTVDDELGVGIDSSNRMLMTTAAGPFTGIAYCIHAGSQRGTSAGSVTPDDRIIDRVFHNDKGAAPDIFGNSPELEYASNLQFKALPFSTISATDTWKCTTGTRGQDALMPGIVAVAWQPATTATANDRVAATIDANSDIVFNSPTAGGGAGWLWVWRKRT